MIQFNLYLSFNSIQKYPFNTQISFKFIQYKNIHSIQKYSFDTQTFIQYANIYSIQKMFILYKNIHSIRKYSLNTKIFKSTGPQKWTTEKFYNFHYFHRTQTKLYLLFKMAEGVTVSENNDDNDLEIKAFLVRVIERTEFLESFF